MALVHYIKKSHNEAIVKCYRTDAGGGTINIALSDLVANGETFDANTAVVTIKEIYWGTRNNKQLDITRVVPSDPSGIHGHYYLSSAGFYQFNGFVDNTYAEKDIRIIGDGAFHVLLKLTKTSGYTQT